jgi:hypothetical protein
MSRSRPSGGGQVKIQFDPDDPTQHITKSGAVHTLTDEQQLFAQTYVENGGDHLAAYAAAYGPNKGGTWARMVIREPSVQRYIQHLKRTRAIPPAEANKLIAELNLPTKTRREERTNGRRVFKAAVKILDRTGILPADAAKTVFDVSRQGVPKPGNAPGAAQEPVHAIETFSAPPDRQEPLSGHRRGQKFRLDHPTLCSTIGSQYPSQRSCSLMRTSVSRPPRRSKPRLALDGQLATDP